MERVPEVMMNEEIAKAEKAYRAAIIKEYKAEKASKKAFKEECEERDKLFDDFYSSDKYDRTKPTPMQPHAAEYYAALEAAMKKYKKTVGPHTAAAAFCRDARKKYENAVRAYQDKLGE